MEDQKNIIIGNDIYIGPGSFWDGLGGINIGDNVIIGPNSVIWSYSHNYKDASYLPYDEVEVLSEVTINENFWIGIRVSIIPGVTIVEEAIIGMSSVVTKDVPLLLS